jgi:Fasciclin domain.
VTDAGGHTADISTYDVTQSNGVIMVVDKVLMPK